MSWFNVLKGASPSLQQIDQVLPVGSSETGLVRGTAMYVDASGTYPVYRVAGAAQAIDPTAYIWYSLIPQDDFTAGMAGTIGQGVGGGYAKVNALACGMQMAFETTEYVADTYDIGTLLTIANGGLLTTLTLSATPTNCVGQVRDAIRSKWQNNAIAITGRKLGANVNVLTVQAMWVPGMRS